MDSSEERLASRLGIPILAEISREPLVIAKQHLLPYEFVTRHALLPIDEQDGLLTVALSDPMQLGLLDEVRRLTGKRVRDVFCPRWGIEHAIALCYDDRGAHDERPDRAPETSDLYEVTEAPCDSPVVELLNRILLEAVRYHASDIHFEPGEGGLVVRCRIDGHLQTRWHPQRDHHEPLITRIKVLAKLDIAERRLPQDGRLKLAVAGRPIDFRVSSVPTSYGERLVMRILDAGRLDLSVASLAMPAPVEGQLRKYMRQTQGIILVTGPTGSGKTTTLYSALSDIHAPGINIMTVEDPVEYSLSGVAQIGVNPKIGLTFATGLRHILRQDPDVIMIGEIRDRETAEIAIQAALTGHLVFSTLHTNDAPSALTRLVEMGVEPYLLTSTVLATIAQRLVRLICPTCVERYTPLDGELSDIGIKRSSLDEGMLCRGRGCEQCYGTGYRGRRGIYELMSVTPPLREQLLKSPDSSALAKLAASSMVPLAESGRALVIEGKTTTDEVIRVLRDEGE
jgi:general secretion pathway protein E